MNGQIHQSVLCAFTVGYVIELEETMSLYVEQRHQVLLRKIHIVSFRMCTYARESFLEFYVAEALRSTQTIIIYRTKREHLVRRQERYKSSSQYWVALRMMQKVATERSKEGVVKSSCV